MPKWTNIPSPSFSKSRMYCLTIIGSVLSQLTVAAVGGLYGGDNGRAEGVLLQRRNARDGASSGGADGVLQFSGMFSALQKELSGAEESLRGVFQCFCPRKTAFYTSVGKRLCKKAD